MSAELYLALKSAHVVAFVAWMAGVFYLPRLFVYHTRLASSDPSYAMFCEMERKLLAVIMTPAAIATWALGLAMAVDIALNSGAPVWLILKTAAVGGMTAFHYICMRHARAFAQKSGVRSERFYRLFNEIPTLLLIVIVVLVIFQPTF